MSRSVLLGLEARGIQAWTELARAIQVAQTIGEVSQASSTIRQVAQEYEPEILRSVVKLSTELEPDDIIIRIKTSTSLSEDISSFNILLLRYMGRFAMTPEMTLPHPHLISEPRWLIAASEIDPDWVHPVLRKPLEELARPFRFSPLYDFYAQGQTLLAFLEPKT